MICPHCGTANQDSAATCSQCARDLFEDAPTVATPSEPPSKGRISEWQRESRNAKTLPVGFEIGSRYKVVGFLGRGGMGAVYRVHDNELNRDVALKLIRADLEEDQNVIDRFKREIHLSSLVTHRNVLRVYDLGESDGVKYLTMQLVEGDDLSHAMRGSNTMPLERATNIFRQICLGLAAAHEQSVIHRDLKPQNIMIGKDDHVYLTDFGLARTSDQPGLTASGAVIGTPDFMSPEQVRGDHVDIRSDIYSLGIIFFQMLTGHLPFQGRSTYEVMMQRVQHEAPTARSLNPVIPERISRIIEKCMATRAAARYASVQEILQDLDGDAAPRLARRSEPMPVAVKRAIAAAVALLAMLGALAAWRVSQREDAPAAARQRNPVSVLIADLDNRSGDPIFNETLEPILSIGLEGAPFVTAYNRGQARRTASELRPGVATLDEALARLVGLREGVQVVIAGSLQRDADSYRLTTRAIDTATGRELGKADESAKDREAVLKVAGTVAHKLRVVLGDAPDEKLSSETFTAGSLAAAQKYAAGQELQWAGKFEQAITRYAEATALDPTMGRAYAGMAAMHANLGDREKAETNYKLAMQHIDRMTDREKYRTSGGYYLFMRNHEQAIEEYRELARQYPADTAALNNLALSYFYRREMKRAMEEQQKPIAIYPKNVLYRNNLALYALYASDFATAAREAAQVLELNPSFVKAYLALGLAKAATESPAEADAAYERLQSVSARGASLASSARADLAMMRGDAATAITLLRAGISADEQAGNNTTAARKRTMLAEALLQSGAKTEAVREAQTAAKGSDDGVRYSAARVLSAAGEFAQSELLAAEMEKRLEPEPQLYAKLIHGENLLLQGRARDAVTILNDAQKLGDSWMGRLLRGRAYIALGAFTEAYGELDVASKRIGEGLAVLLDDVPTARYLPFLYYELARAQDGLGSPAARGSYEKFLRARSSATNDVMVADARKRLGTS
jgi:eukaryotic-like serine/threonine-protein kinase